MQLVRLNSRQSIGEHAGPIESVQLLRERFFDLFRLDAHQRRSRPIVRQITIIGEATAKFSVFDLAMIDVPEDHALEIPELLDLAKGPQRTIVRRSRLSKDWFRMTPVAVVPIRLCQPMIWIDTQEVGHVGCKSIVEIQPWIVGVFLDQHGVAVARLGKTIEFVFLCCFCSRPEDQANVRASKRCRSEILTSTGDRQVKTLARRQDAIARVEPERACFIRLDGKTEVEQAPLHPERILHLDIQREVFAMRRLHAQRRQIDSEADETVLNILPAFGRYQYVNQGQYRCRLQISNCGFRIDRTGIVRDCHDCRAFIRRVPSRDESP